MGTSLGGLYVMHADLSEVPWCKRIICNPACHIANDIREKIGFGVKEYFVPRQDGIQQYVLDEDVCRELERDSRLDLMTPGDVSLNFAVFSIHDELIGPVGISYTVLVDDKGGHRLEKNSHGKIRNEIFMTEFSVLKN
jgi:hypothetical protein